MINLWEYCCQMIFPIIICRQFTRKTRKFSGHKLLQHEENAICYSHAWKELKESNRKKIRIDFDPKCHSSTVDVFLVSVGKVHRDIECVVNILLKPIPEKNKRERVVH